MTVLLAIGRELASLEPPVDSPEAFCSALRARTNRLNKKKSRQSASSDLLFPGRFY